MAMEKNENRREQRDRVTIIPPRNLEIFFQDCITNDINDVENDIVNTKVDPNQNKKKLRNLKRKLGKLKTIFPKTTFYLPNNRGTRKFANIAIRKCKNLNKIKLIWINPTILSDPMKDLCFGEPDQREFFSYSEIEEHFEIFLVCNSCLSLEDFEIFCNIYKLTDQQREFFLKNGEPAFFNLKFKIEIYNFNLNNGTYIDTFSLNIIHEKIHNDELKKQTFAEYNIYDMSSQVPARNLRKTRKMIFNNKKSDFLINCKSKAVKKIKPSNLKHQDLVDE